MLPISTVGSNHRPGYVSPFSLTLCVEKGLELHPYTYILHPHILSIFVQSSCVPLSVSVPLVTVVSSCRILQPFMDAPLTVYLHHHPTTLLHSSALHRVYLYFCHTQSPLSVPDYHGLIISPLYLISSHPYFLCLSHYCFRINSGPAIPGRLTSRPRIEPLCAVSLSLSLSLSLSMPFCLFLHSHFLNHLCFLIYPCTLYL